MTSFKVCFVLLSLPVSAVAWISSALPVGVRRHGNNNRCDMQRALCSTTTTTVAAPRIEQQMSERRMQSSDWNWNDRIESTIKSCQTAVSALILSGLVILAPYDYQGNHNNIIMLLRPPPAAAAEVIVGVPPLSSSLSTESTSNTLANVIQETTRAAYDTSSSNEIMTIPPIRQESSTLDEVWGLIDKYYIDRTFNKQDWASVKTKYASMLNIAKKSDDGEMRLITEMVKTLGDKYSRVLDKNQYAAIQKYDLIGVGVTLMPNDDKDIIVGAPPIPGAAADLAGLKVGDYVRAVNGINTRGRTAFDIIDQIAEIPNAKTITMTVQSGKGGPVKEIVMNRLLQEMKNPIRYKLSETRPDGTKVGYIRISEFNSLVKANLEEALAALVAHGANAFVLDLRMNAGGAFQSAVEISGLFVEDRVATYVVDGTQAQLPFKTTKGTLAIDASYPLVLWIDGGSASASEVLAGSLHDNCRAVLMGDTSFGKGLIQAVYGLKNGAGLVLTVARYVTPGGTDIQGVGIQPDIPGSKIVPPPIPGFSSDTSKVDFDEIRSRLDPKLCQLPAART